MVKKVKKERLLEQILCCQDMLQGSIVKINSRCGKKGCKCERGEYHGISYYLSYRKGGRTQMVYIPKHFIAEVTQRIADFKRYWDLGVKLAKVNLHQLQEKQKRTPKKAQ